MKNPIKTVKYKSDSSVDIGDQKCWNNDTSTYKNNKIKEGSSLLPTEK